MIKNDSVRLRFAPSPTGALHIGGVRTAMYNYLFAKKLGGTFMLRIEDTDAAREVPGAEQYIKDAFEWLGMSFDEGPGIGGSYGPYKQSDRKSIYKDYADQLIKAGKAYYAFDTSEELDAVRESVDNFSYDKHTRGTLKNSLTLSEEEVSELVKTKKDYVIRVKYPDTPIDIVCDDMIRGKITINSATLDDKVIWKKKDELPTYHLANIVDDHLMEISHVIRGEEWIPSSPLHIYLYDCFGWVKPQFAHLPLILGPKGKLSKRDGDKYGFPVYPLEWTDPKTKIVSSGYKSMGYTPEAVINILAFLGWNPGTEKEMYTIDELIQDFDISRVNKSGAKFNPDKAAWFNGQHLKTTETSKLLPLFKSEIEKRGMDINEASALKILEDNKNKVNFVSDIFEEASYLFSAPTDFPKKALKKWKNNTHDLLVSLSATLDSVSDWDEKTVQDAFEAFVESKGINFGSIAPQLRLVLTGKANGPSTFGVMELIGKEETLKRLLVNPKGEIKETVTFGIADTVNFSKITELQSELSGVSKSISSTEKKVHNPNFREKAPVSEVAKAMDRLTKMKKRKSEIEKELDTLKQ